MQIIILFYFILHTTSTFTDINDNPIRPRLRLTSQRTFSIMNIADIHYGESPSTLWGPEQDMNSTIAMKKYLNYHLPELVVFTGDLITGENMSNNATDYIDILTVPLREKGVKWSSTYGNHDIGPEVSRESLLQAEQKYTLSYTKRGPKRLEGITNYILKVYPTIKDGDLFEQPKLFLLFLDSQGGKDKHGEIEAKVGDKSIRWLQRQLNMINFLYRKVPILLFFHIPIQQFKNAQNIYPELCSQGLNDDDVTPQDTNNLFEVIKQHKNIYGVFVGHDHGLNWCCKYNNINLCFNSHSGYGGYGNWERGVRIVNIKFDKEYKMDSIISYVQYENGNITGRFNLK